jgi:hypothetical protein
MKNYLALIILIAVAGGGTIYGMKHKNKITFMKKYAPPYEIVVHIEALY